MAVEKIVQWSKKEHSKTEKAIALVSGVIIFVFLIPSLLVYEGKVLDSVLGLQNLLPEPANLIVGFLLAIVGWFFAGWSVYTQNRIGKGTPVPLVLARRLITSGPYKYCRNPMVFGTSLLYVGLSVIFNTVSALFILFF